MISDEVGLAIMNDCNFEDYTYSATHNVDYTYSATHNVSTECNTALNDAYSIVGSYINPYDVILDVCYPSIVQQELRLRKVVSS